MTGNLQDVHTKVISETELMWPAVIRDNKQHTRSGKTETKEDTIIQPSNNINLES